MVWVGANGEVEPLAAPRRAYTDPAISPDGGSIAVSIQGPTQTIWIYDLSRSTLTTLPSAGSTQAPAWTPDGLRLIYRATQGGRRNIFWRAADGTGDEERLTTSDTLQTPTMVSRQGMRAFFFETSAATGPDLWMMPLEGARRPEVVLRTRFTEASARLSPDGRWLAYSSDESGRNEIYIRAFGHTGGKFSISTDGGSAPLWSHDGRQLFYRNRDKMMGVDIGSGPTPTAGAPHLIFSGTYQVSDTGVAGYDVASDGRFLMIQPNTSPLAGRHIQVVLNWFSELRRDRAQ
jgi:serine/threonine-protein kinase